MLQHEQTDPPTVSPPVPLPVPNAADARVTPDELNAALKALEDRQNSTVAIGSVVDELRLNATPEQIWEQVQQQREQKQQMPKLAAVTAASAPARRRMRTWRDIKGWAWVLFWCTGGLGWATLSPLLHHGIPVAKQAIPAAGVVVTGDDTSGKYQVQGTGAQRDVFVGGDHDSIIVTGAVRNLTVDGDHNDVWVTGSVEKVTVDQDYNAVHWTKELPGKSVNPIVDGDHNAVSLTPQSGQ